MTDFWSLVGGSVKQSAEATEKLVCNLGAEYQRLKQQMAVSGCATDDGTPQLRGSSTLFQLYEEYYSLYFPQGGSTMPKMILTESSSLMQ